MPGTPHNFYRTTNVSFNTTYYWSLFNGAGSSIAAETTLQYKFKGAAIVSNAVLTISANTITTSPTVFRMRKNSADANITWSVDAGVTGTFSDLINNDSFADTDLYCVQAVIPNTSGSITYNGVACSVELSSSSERLYIVGGIAQTTAANGVTRWHRLTFVTDVNTEDSTKLAVTAAGKFCNFQWQVLSNPKTATTTSVFRKNGADGNSTISVGSGATGLFQDPTNEDTVAVGDLVNYQTAYAASTGSMSTCRAIEFRAAGKVLMGCGGSTTTITANTSRNWNPLNGTVPNTSTTAQPLCRSTCLLSNLFLDVDSNSITATSTATIRINDVDGNQTMSIPTSTSGTFEDTTNKDWLKYGDLFWARIAAGATGATMSVYHWSLCSTPFNYPSKYVNQSVKRAAFH